MHDRTEHDETAARMSAITAAEILADFMRDGLPLVAWTVQAEYAPFSSTFPLLVGVCHLDDGPDRERIVKAYAERLGVEPRDPYGDGKYIEAVAELRGIWLRVWARAR